jgi:outer membrane receptor protein involved in Fe transport
VGLLVPQVPRQQFTLQTTYANPHYTLAAQGRAVGVQFDDDQNQLPLGRFFTLDLYAARRLPHGSEVFVAVENALDHRYQVARTPVVSLGPPALVRVGVKVDWWRK